MKCKGRSIASMLLGIAAAVLLFIPKAGWASFICSIAGLALGIISKKRTGGSNAQTDGTAIANAGIVLSIISPALLFLTLAVVELFLKALSAGL